MDRSRHASVEVSLHWSSADASHRERLYLDRVSLCQDVFPAGLGERLGRAKAGDPVQAELGPGEAVPGLDPALQLRVPLPQLRRRLASGATLEPRAGRFYPRGWLSGLPGVYPQDRRPFRFLGAEGESARVDLNHPLAAYPLTFEGRVLAEAAPSEEHGGRSNEVAKDLVSGGPGCQSRCPEIDTDFFAGEPFARADEREDRVFYAEPRLVQHLDATAVGQVRALYGRLLRPGMRVLDLMSSWTSHLPESAQDLQVTGLGMNRAELEHNLRLAQRVVQDLNRDPVLPFADASFDAVVCTVSVEYLIRPFEVFAELARVLRPGAPLAFTFSDRWFPPKVVRVWTELHPFERMGLVLAYFRQTGAFEGLGTETTRGWPRPEGDKYAQVMAYADPLYAVWGYRRPAGEVGQV
jgi:SAM-dependent methyltransferase